MVLFFFGGPYGPPKNNYKDHKGLRIHSYFYCNLVEIRIPKKFSVCIFMIILGFLISTRFFYYFPTSNEPPICLCYFVTCVKSDTIRWTDFKQLLHAENNQHWMFTAILIGELQSRKFLWKFNLNEIIIVGAIWTGEPLRAVKKM